jgi:hypothetical protein
MKCPILCRDTLGNAPKIPWRPLKQYPKAIGDFWEILKSTGDLFSNAYRVADILWEMPK